MRAFLRTSVISLIQTETGQQEQFYLEYFYSFIQPNCDLAASLCCALEEGSIGIF